MCDAGNFKIYSPRYLFDNMKSAADHKKSWVSELDYLSNSDSEDGEFQEEQRLLKLLQQGKLGVITMDSQPISFHEEELKIEEDRQKEEERKYDEEQKKRRIIYFPKLDYLSNSDSEDGEFQEEQLQRLQLLQQWELKQAEEQKIEEDQQKEEERKNDEEQKKRRIIYRLFFLLSYIEHLLNLLFNLITINKAPPDHHLQVIINAKLCLDIERNPGPIHQRCFDAAQRFCEEQTPTNFELLKKSVSKTLITQEAFPETFLSDEKVIIWRNVLNILDQNNFDNLELKKEIFSLHDSWEDSLIKKESPQQNESPHCKCDLHGTSCPSMTDSHHTHGTPIAPVNERALPQQQIFQIIQNTLTTETETNGILKITDEEREVCAQPFTTPPVEVEALSPQTMTMPLQPNSPLQQIIQNVVINAESTENLNTNRNIQNAISLEGTANDHVQPSTSLSIVPISPQRNYMLQSIQNIAIKEEFMDIFNTNNESVGVFSYGRLLGTKPCKFVCQTDCEMKKSQNKDLVKEQGVIRETLINHARLCHKIKPDFQKKKAFVVEQLKCAACKKVYTKKQELKKHMKNKHPDFSSNSPGANPSTTHQGPEPSTNVVSDPSAQTDPEAQFNSSFPQIDNTSTQIITHIIPSSTIHEMSTVSSQDLRSILGTYQSAPADELPDNLNNILNQMETDEETSNYDTFLDFLSQGSSLGQMEIPEQHFSPGR